MAGADPAGAGCALRPALTYTGLAVNLVMCTYDLNLHSYGALNALHLILIGVTAFFGSKLF